MAARLTAWLAILLLPATAAWAETGTATHTYVNRAGSSMQFQRGADGAITGSYTSAVGCGVGVERKLVGWINGSAITFTVSFGECDSATSWTGHIDKQGVISSIWILARSGEKDGAWNARLTGSSVFTPSTSPGAGRVR